VDHAFHPGTSLLHTVTGPDGTVYAAMTGYQPSGKIGVLDYGNNVRTTYGYDGWSQRLTSIHTAKDQGAGDKYQDRLYYYSRAGDIEQIDDQAWVETYYYAYDKLHRLTSETTSTGSVGVMPGILEMQYDNPDHLHAASSVTTSGLTYDYDYDPNGNMTAGPDVSDIVNVVQRSLTFNGDNMPTTVVHPKGGTVNMTYGLCGTMRDVHK
jgi:YD repeat-containing protein